ncbi:DUF1801 domain-containing protein [Cellulomonas xylanilytica]|uniref:YdhG-like domain-containing protein n=1 Tax=Cellulomonas xylanilytica TaxID=233583 RepID=A0A510UYL6_9CELL|nr:DUF1801 domain-containing protein [Cellulomonas xylanilytica]GEK19757.1 hypothetical protein CXY01_02770 [Cellulomonas xylanilytica]
MAHEPNKTVPTDADVAAFVAAVEHPVRRRDAERLIDLMARVTGEQPRMWGPTIVGFGTYHYRYPSGREGSAGAAGFSPRKAATTVYFPDGAETHADLLADLGPHTIGKSCLYLKDLDAVDLGVLEEMVRRSYATVTAGTFGTRLSGPDAG